MTNKDCSLAGELIPQFLAGRLSAEDEEMVRAHIAICSDCRQRANAVSLLQQTPVPSPDPDRWDQFVDDIVQATTDRDKRTGRRGLRLVAVLAAAALIVFSWVRFVRIDADGSNDIESIAREVAELPDAEIAAWTAGLNPSGFMTAGFDASELGESELEELETEVERS